MGADTTAVEKKSEIISMQRKTYREWLDDSKEWCQKDIYMSYSE